MAAAYTAALPAKEAKVAKPPKSPPSKASQQNCRLVHSNASKYILKADGWKLNEKILLVLRTHSDKIPPASALASKALRLVPIFVSLLIIFKATMKGTKQKFIKVNLYS